jgi:hypothetical protein
MRRISVPVPGTEGAELVGYVVMAHAEDGTATPRPVFGMADLDGLAVDAETPVPCEALDNVRAELAIRAGKDFQLLAAARRIEEANEAAGRSQARLTRLVARHFILSAQRARRGEANFWRQLAILDDIVEHCAEQRLPRMPVDQLRSVSGVPFAIRLPGAGSEMHFDAPRPLLRAAADLAAREADALHVAKAGLSTEEVLRRL